jgi:hypothetical protein
MRFKLSAVAIVLLASAASCAPHQPPPPPSAVGNQPLAASTEVPGALVYRVPNIDQLPPPRCFYIPDTEVYNGPDAQYYGVDEEQRRQWLRPSPMRSGAKLGSINGFARLRGRGSRPCSSRFMV